jgi:hypothetical protein
MRKSVPHSILYTYIFHLKNFEQQKTIFDHFKFKWVWKYLNTSNRTLCVLGRPTGSAPTPLFWVHHTRRITRGAATIARGLPLPWALGLASPPPLKPLAQHQLDPNPLPSTGAHRAGPQLPPFSPLLQREQPQRALGASSICVAQPPWS